MAVLFGRLSASLTRSVLPRPPAMAAVAQLSTGTDYETLQLSQPKPNVTLVELARPAKFNSFTRQMWLDIGRCMGALAADERTHAIVLAGRGRAFSAGIDFNELVNIGQTVMSDEGGADVARRALKFDTFAKEFQDCFTAVSLCAKPVIAAVHGFCVGAGVDLVTAADVRLCSQDAVFSVREVKMAIIADIGTLQRLPKVVNNDSWARDVCLTGRDFGADEALLFGLVSRVFADADSLRLHAVELAGRMTALSTVAVQGTKRVLNYSREHSAQQGLDYVRTLNMSQIQTDDVVKAAMDAVQSKGKRKANM